MNDLLPQDESGNAIQGDVFSYLSSGNLVQSNSRFVATLGVQDLIVVETPDAVLVASKAQAQNVKQVVQYLQLNHRPEAENHTRVGANAFRLNTSPSCRDRPSPNKGTASVTRGEEVRLLTENESVYIPVGTIHRLENPGTIDLELIEVQSGAYLGEDDIVRFEDRYHRHETPT